MDSEHIDRLLRAWFSDELPESERAEALEQLLLHVQPFARKVAGYRMGTRSDQVDDVVQQVLLKLTVVLVDRRASGEGMKDLDFVAYLRKMVKNASVPYNPARARVAARLRYWLESEEYDRWQVDEFDVCGGAEYRDQDPLDISVENSEVNEAVAAEAKSEKSFPDAVKAMFQAAGGPIYFNVAVGILSKYFAIRLRTRIGEEEDSNIWELLADKGLSPERRTGLIEGLRLVWDCVTPMSLEWKRAFLLNPGNGASGTVFVSAEIVTKEGFREQLKMEPEVFNPVFDRLPIEDAEIASLFGVSPASVTSHRWRAIRKVKKYLGTSKVTRI